MHEFHMAIDAIRQANLVTQSNAIRNGLPKILNTVQWVKEYATVSLNVHRQSGKTQYIIDRASPLDLVIVHNRYMINHYLDQTFKLKLGKNLFSIAGMENCLRGKKLAFQNVYLDEASLKDEDISFLMHSFPTIQQFVRLAT